MVPAGEQAEGRPQLLADKRESPLQGQRGEAPALLPWSVTTISPTGASARRASATVYPRSVRVGPKKAPPRLLVEGESPGATRRNRP